MSFFSWLFRRRPVEEAPVKESEEVEASWKGHEVRVNPGKKDREDRNRGRIRRLELAIAQTTDPERKARFQTELDSRRRYLPKEDD